MKFFFLLFFSFWSGSVTRYDYLLTLARDQVLLHLYPLLNPRMQCHKRQVEDAVCACMRCTLNHMVTHPPSPPCPLPSNCVIVLQVCLPPLHSVHPTPSRNHMMLYGPTHLYVCAQYDTSLRRVLPQGWVKHDKLMACGGQNIFHVLLWAGLCKLLYPSSSSDACQLRTNGYSIVLTLSNTVPPHSSLDT